MPTVKEIFMSRTGSGLRKNPIPYETFASAGWNEVKFILYLSEMDNFRSICKLWRSTNMNGNYAYLRNSLVQYSDKIITTIYALLGIDIPPQVLKRTLDLLSYPMQAMICDFQDVNFFCNNNPKFEMIDAEKLYFQGLLQDLDNFRASVEAEISIYLHSGFRRLWFFSSCCTDGMSIEQAEKKLEYNSCKIDEKELVLALDKNSIVNRDFDFSNSYSLSRDIKDFLWTCWDLQELYDENSEIEHYLFDCEKHDRPYVLKTKLFIHRGLTKCQRENHNIVSMTASVPARNNNSVDININYCRNCDRHFISYDEFEYYRKLYGFTIGNFEMDASSGDGYYPRAEKSLLYLCGYNVSQEDDLSDEDRQYILQKIMDHEIMDKPSIISRLNMLIRTNGAKIGNEIAVQKWKQDIDFVRNYGMQTQPKVKIDEVIPNNKVKSKKRRKKTKAKA